MDYPIRKPNRLKNWDYGENGSYFVTICTKEKRHLLSSIPVGDGFPVPLLTKTGLLVERQILSIPEHFPDAVPEKYIIMPNHIHMILILHTNRHGTGNPSPTLGSVIGWFKYQTTQEINRISETVGQPFWQRSYHDHIIRNDAEHLSIWQYIDTNPSRWNLDCYYEPM